MNTASSRTEPDVAPVLGELDCHLLAEGSHWRAYERLGAHACTRAGIAGVAFAVWAPNAERVSVVGTFNDWDGRRHAMHHRAECGAWELFVAGVAHGDLYKFSITGADGRTRMKSDPFALWMETPPRTAARVWSQPAYGWSDGAWMAQRAAQRSLEAPLSIYEVHLGSWRRRRDGGVLGYRELADTLVAHVRAMGFTHIELMPIGEFPFGGSWGYQPVALFAPTARLGTPDDLRTFIDCCHAAGIGVLLDWVPGHFPDDEHGLARFDGTCLYEHEDPRRGRQRDWNTLVYNLGRHEVANFLIANALYWLREFHIDGLRVDAVASMLYLDYSRASGDWLPNAYGGRENLEAIEFLRRFNTIVHTQAPPGVATIAEESTAWPGVTRPPYTGGLGFDYKWNMGWMNDTLRYMRRNPVHRRHHHDEVTFGLLYAHTENFVLPLSHDEVVHGKHSLLAKMPGDRWQRFANLRLYLAFLFTQPGKKLLFMGGEFAQEHEWQHDGELDWPALGEPLHAGVQRLVARLNELYRALPCLHERDCDSGGFAWIDCEDKEQSVFCYRRCGRDGTASAIVVCNFTPIPRHRYRVGVECSGIYREILNTDAGDYGGSGIGNLGCVHSEPIVWHGQAHSLALELPPLAALMLLPP
jgi:1,4-alpha-glucan branching enzyme